MAGGLEDGSRQADGHSQAPPPGHSDGRKWPGFERRGGREEEPPGPRLWVGNLSPTVTEKELMDRFSP
jgi:hypothetical protein